jgi:4-deoxy-L-threo-5-hexosulose-uronate ketol-isomerase
MTHEIRYAIHPNDFRSLQTNQLREAFLVSDIFQDDLIKVCYSHYDRFILGGAKPVATPLALQPFNALKADYFLQRREIGIINVGGKGVVSVDGNDFELAYKEALYIGRDVKEVVFHAGENPLFYFNSAPAHTSYPTRKIGSAEASVTELGSAETSNHRTIRKLIVHGIVETCQLQMGLTELKSGSVWNTMPPHTHD